MKSSSSSSSLAEIVVGFVTLVFRSLLELVERRDLGGMKSSSSSCNTCGIALVLDDALCASLSLPRPLVLVPCVPLVRRLLFFICREIIGVYILLRNYKVNPLYLFYFIFIY